jgi:simple sugar transport system permease protein
MADRMPRWLTEGVVIPLASVVAGIVVAGLFVLASGSDPVAAMSALFQGAVTNQDALPETLVTTTPYLLVGLGLALGFRAGLFNIGAEGQFYVGALAGTFAGYSIRGLPGILEIPIALACGMAGGFLWAGVAGALKARFGAHEVITTIMLNYVAFLLANYLVDGGPMFLPGSVPQHTPNLDPNVQLPVILPGTRLHLGLLIALACVPLVWLLMERTTIGFRLRAVGFNPEAARAAGISVGWTTVLTMGLSGGLAGLAGIVQILGLNQNMTAAVGAGYGFNSIAVALLARSNPWAVLPAALLFAGLQSGAGFMQLDTQVSSDLVSIVQATVIIFVAAPMIIRWLLRLREGQATAVRVAPVGQGGPAA